MSAEALPKRAHAGLGDGRSRLRLDLFGVDPDREGADADHATVAEHQLPVTLLRPAIQARIRAEAIRVASGLESHQVMREQRAEQTRVIRQRDGQIRGRHRHVQEEADAATHAAFPQQRGQRDQMVVVDPDQVVGRQQRHQPIRECGIHASVTVAGHTAVFHQVQP